MAHDIVIVGGGLAGLCAARELHAQGAPYRLFEASDEVGGRVRTDVVDGFRLDRGFQVLLEAYPEARRVLDYDALELCRFYPGTLVRHGGAFRRLADPMRRPFDAVRSLFGGVGTVGDKLRMLGLRRDAKAGDLDALFARPEQSAADALGARGFSEAMIAAFLGPWLGGVFLESALETSSRMLEFVIRMFASGRTAVPAAGMGAIPRQIAAGLDADRIHTCAPVTRVNHDRVELASGSVVDASAVIVATEEPVAWRLLGTGGTAPRGSGVACLYFATESDPIGEPILVLDGDAGGPVNNLVVPSAVSPKVAPAGAALVSASVLDRLDSPDEALERDVRAHLGEWFGPGVHGWRRLATYRIPYALPHRPAGSDLGPRAPRSTNGIFVCGDHLETGSIQGAMRSGRRAAEAVLESIREPSTPAGRSAAELLDGSVPGGQSVQVDDAAGTTADGACT